MIYIINFKENSFQCFRYILSMDHGIYGVMVIRPALLYCILSMAYIFDSFADLKIFNDRF